MFDLYYMKEYHPILRIKHIYIRCKIPSRWTCKTHLIYITCKKHPFHIYNNLIFVSVSHRTGLDTRSMTWRSIIMEIRVGEGRAWAEAQALLDYAGHWPTVQCGSDEPSWMWTVIWVQIHMPDYISNWTARSSAIQAGQRCEWCSSPTQRWLSWI